MSLWRFCRAHLFRIVLCKVDHGYLGGNEMEQDH